MALTRVKDSMSNPRPMHQVEYSPTTSLSLHQGTIFWISTFVSGSWTIDLVDVPTDSTSYVIEYTVYWYRSTGGANPTVKVNGTTIGTQVAAVAGSTSVLNAHMTKIILLRRDSSGWLVNHFSTALTSTQSSHPAYLF